MIIPAYNAQQYIGSTVASVLRQNVGNLEVIAVDDGSTDATRSILGAIRDPRLTALRQQNKGVAAARNHGFRASAGEFVMFLDADDLLRPDALERLRAALVAHPRACASYGTERNIDAEGLPISSDREARSRFVKRASGDILQRILSTNFIVNGGVVLARRRCVAAFGGYDETLPISEDWMFTCRLAAAGDFVFVGNEPVLDYRFRTGSLARTTGTRAEAFAAAIDKVFTDPRVTSRLPREALVKARRRRESDVLRRAGTETLRRRDWPGARRYFLRSVLRHPGNLRSLILLVCCLVRRVPGPVARKIGL